MGEWLPDFIQKKYLLPPEKNMNLRSTLFCQHEVSSMTTSVWLPPIPYSEMLLLLTHVTSTRKKPF